MTSEWHQRWQEGRIGFHEEKVHRDLIDFHGEFLPETPLRILVPLCGKSIDLCWLAELGHEVVGVELVDDAVKQFFADNKLVPKIGAAGTLQRYQSGRITVLQGDIFAATTELAGVFDRIWDRAALIALPPSIRPSYVAHLRSLLTTSGAKVLLNTIEYDTSVMDGPPFSVSSEEIARHYGDKGLRLLREKDEIEEVPRFRERGHKYWLGHTHLVQF